MEDAGVCPAGDDGGVGEAPGAGADELVDEFRFEFPFADAWLYEWEDAAEACFGDFAGFFCEGDFFFGFNGAELVDEWC